MTPAELRAESLNRPLPLSGLNSLIFRNQSGRCLLISTIPSLLKNPHLSNKLKGGVAGKNKRKETVQWRQSLVLSSHQTQASLSLKATRSSLPANSRKRCPQRCPARGFPGIMSYERTHAFPPPAGSFSAFPEALADTYTRMRCTLLEGSARACVAAVSWTHPG